MYTCLVLGDNSALAVRAESAAKEKIHLSPPYSMPCLLDCLDAPDLLASHLKEAAAALDSASDIWLVSLPLSVLSWQCVSVPLGQLPEPDAIENWMLKHLPATCDKDAYTAYISMTKDSPSVTYVSAGFLRKDILENIVAAFRLADLDFYLVEPEVTATARYLKHVSNVEQTAFLSASNSLILMTEFGIITAKQVQSRNHLSIIENYAKSKIPESAESQTVYCTLNENFERELVSELPTVDLTLKNPFIGGASFRAHPLLLPACGLLLTRIKRKEPFHAALRKLFASADAGAESATS